MYKSNIEFIINSTNKDEPIYGILALVGDTLESMKADVASHRIDEEQRRAFRSAMKDMVSGLIKLDGLVDQITSKVR
ncbi:hypothetical protein ACE5IS_00400 [Leptospira wolffii]|uniref:Uncharacterized protein n=1 Tax=Leptospira wolffii TaxID=409998 RepID=A0A2M9ZFR0_9LEPT|nr:hypothetical protein [Leptospira wolffii]EPG65044.1 hypothetical protein LEP1GSC061_3275 [Leptospira wolffii serovar Khorat str. Khorat-H2]PJZ67252.1 hypothetical protein CH371_04145 [Leptospira wolffii]TGK62242.1 hypothetical protein EHQ32_05270 [Leptospira wolffii]TGK68240.1 hypothetical protein EHQ27_14930 [Leptospira wolffii]TGK74374.1 hypothetical protein EHQ35_08505 [Leptospira wolffii]